MLSRLAVLILLLLPIPVHAGDWPMSGHDPRRTNSTPERLPDTLYLRWLREFPPLDPAWPDQKMMQFDSAYDPIVAGKTLFLASSRHDCLFALDTGTGKEKWRFYAEGPIRFAPLAWQERVYFVADDGYLYCLDAESGKLQWKFRGGPGDRKILGNQRLISTWPARGAPVIADDTVYFAASIWPFMGVFIHALDARTGSPVWCNDGDGSLYMKQPHNADSFAGVAPQGHLAVLGNRLFLPGGRSIPACYDRKTGKLQTYRLAENGKKGGGSHVALADKFFCNGGGLFDLDAQKYLTDIGQPVVVGPKHFFALAKNQLRVLHIDLALQADEDDDAEADEPKKPPTKKLKLVKNELASIKLPGLSALIQAGERLYAGVDKEILALDYAADEGELNVAWKLSAPGQVARLIAADGYLFAVTREGHLVCYGKKAPAQEHAVATHDPNDVWAARAKALLDVTKARAGYAIVHGVGSGNLALELLRQSDLHVIVVDADAAKVKTLRDRKVAEDLARLSVHLGRPADFPFPPYLASLIVSEDWEDLEAADHARLFQTLRPFGGMAVFPRDYELDAATGSALNGAKIVTIGDWKLLVREGPLPGSANWTHEHADAANTRVSQDRLAKAPLGLLWFGGPSHDGILPRHGHGPQPQVVDGRLIIEGVNFLRALDIYTGRLLWETELPGVGKLYNNLAHQPGANAAGSNYVSTPDGIFVAYERSCLVLDPATGKKIGAFKLPLREGQEEPSLWGYLNVAGDYLVGGAEPLFDPKSMPIQDPKFTGDDPDPSDKKKDSLLAKLLKTVKGPSDNFSSSKRLVVFDRKSGKVLWTANATHGFRHNAVCIGGGRLYAIDRLSGLQLRNISKDGPALEPSPSRLIVFDLATGKELWHTEDDVFGTWLSFSQGFLIEAGRVARDTIFDEPRGMRAYDARSGKVLWHKPSYTGPAMILGDTILQGQGGCDLRTGALKMRLDPITGASVPWQWTRNYGCNTPAASQNLLTFRSGAAGYFDLCNDGGTGNFGGFRSSCTNNLIVAGGIITAPEYTRTCTCAYQNQASIALVHMPDAEMWTFIGTKDAKGPIQRLGINFGAPGDRKTEEGTLWLEYPSVAGHSPSIPMLVAPGNPTYFRRHSGFVDGPLPWVASSGIRGVKSTTINLGKTNPASAVTVRLVFCEPDPIPAGKRRFHVFINGQEVLHDFDIVREASGSLKSIVKEFANLPLDDRLILNFVPAGDSPLQEAIVSGIQILAR